MRVLVASTVYPLPANDGLRLQLAGLLRALRELGHEVVLVCGRRDDDEIGPHDGLCDRLVQVDLPRGRGHRVAVELLSLPTRRPVLVQQVCSSGLPAAVRRAVAQTRPDVVHLTPGWLAELGRGLGAPTVLVPLDASRPNHAAEADSSTGLRRYLRHRERDRMLRAERVAYPHADEVVVVTERDADMLRANGVERVHVVTNGVDLGPWARPADAPRQVPGLVVLSGAMSYAPNVAAAEHLVRDVLPLLREQVPSAHVRLVGRDPSRAVLALIGPDVEVTGTVPDVAPHLWQAAAYACTMVTGTGVKNKLMEAMAASCACVVTPLASAGLDLVDGVQALVADSPQGLADALARVLTEPQLASALGEGARAHASGLTWRRTAEGFLRVYESAIARSSAGQAGGGS